ncbi:hypothetical protein PGQ11_009415 [Apiospora arundinis]|uniref:Subtilisin-like serine protease n=1 Tax=Apiospora arundinis TaxID=335852 RepID=A0ABR2IJ36_9PEZI
MDPPSSTSNSTGGRSPLWPFATEVLDYAEAPPDALPAVYHQYEPLGRTRKRRIVLDPTEDVSGFVNTELSLGDLCKMEEHLWFAGAKHPATPLHFQVAMGRIITVADRMDLHLLWDNASKIYLKPIPGFLLDTSFWAKYLKCPDACACRPEAAANQAPLASCRKNPRQVALGFLYTYACLVCSESDFFVANKNRLLPRQANGLTIEWEKWKKLAREVIKNHDPEKVHPRFQRAELRLSRINTIHRFTRLPPFNPYLGGWRDYSSLFRDNFTWISAATIFVALVLTAMQVGLATDRLQENDAFQRASYGFTVFAILGPLCAFGLVIVAALFNLVKDLPWLLWDRTGQAPAPFV